MMGTCLASLWKTCYLGPGDDIVEVFNFGKSTLAIDLGTWLEALHDDPHTKAWCNSVEKI